MGRFLYLDSQFSLLSRMPGRTRVNCLTQIMPWFEQQRQSGWGRWNEQDPELRLAPQSGVPLEPSNASPARFSSHLATCPSSSTTQTLPGAIPVTAEVDRSGDIATLTKVLSHSALDYRGVSSLQRESLRQTPKTIGESWFLQKHDLHQGGTGHAHT